MKGFTGRLAMKAILAACSIYPAIADAAPLTFDCDVPPDHFSSVAQDVSGPMAISGIVEPAQLRSGKNVPVAGVRIVTPDGKSSTGFQLVANTPQAEQFDIVLNVTLAGDLKRTMVGQIGTAGAIAFSLTLSEAGKVALVIGGGRFEADFIPMSSGKEMAFCSTGQFKFSDLTFALATPSR